MIETRPRVWKIAETRTNDTEIRDWLEYLNGTECLEHITGNDGERLVELAGRRCYKSFKPGLNPNVSKVRKNSEEYHRNTMSARHGSIDEHVSVTFAIEGVSRVFCPELCRHRAGTAFSQESLRYVRLNNIEFWIPEVFSQFGEDAAEKSVALTRKTVEFLEGVQSELADIFQIEKIAKFDLKKKLTSAFRRLAPEGLATGIVFTANVRALRHIIEVRTSRHAEEELRLVFGMIADIMIRDYPLLFGDFKKVDTGDGYFEYVPEFSKI